MRNVQSQGHGTPSHNGGTREPREGADPREPEQGKGLLADGPGDRGDHRGRQFAPGFRDARRTITIIASGPSAGSTKPEHRRRFPALCINDAWRLHPEAEGLYAADPRWWEVHGQAVADGWKGGPCFGSHTCGPEYGVQPGRRIPLARRRVIFEPGLSRDPAILHGGGAIGNSGAQGINLAVHAGAHRLLLLGFDMRKVEGQDHFFGPHPAPLNQVSPYEVFWKGMWSMALALNELGIEVLNGSPDSALPYWPRLSPAELDALCAPTS